MKEFRIAHMVIGQVATNCYLLYNNETRKTIMVDPPEQGAKLYETLKQNQLELEAILLTHGHFDHMMAADMPEIKVIHTPGHTAGSVCFYLESEGILICGDTLFQESVGRTDLPTGSQSALVKSIREKIFVLPENVIVYPGHGDETTIGYEKVNNPYV